MIVRLRGKQTPRLMRMWCNWRDTADLKSATEIRYGFESRHPHQRI